jgi:glucose/arabinose dehydrogenase
MKKIFAIKIFLLLYNVVCLSQITFVQFANGFTNPLELTNAGDKRIFVVEQAGRIIIVDSAGVKKATPFLNIQSRVLSGGERGLLGLAFSPDYVSSGFFYVNYTRQTDGFTRISRFSVSRENPDSAVANSEQILLTIRQPFSNHNGGSLKFGPDGFLYVGMGDGGSGGDPGNRAQNLDSLLGKMLRIDVNDGGSTYSIPASNPFVGIAGRDEIWEYGFRNPWKFSFDKLTGDLWIADVGQDSYEEINFQDHNSTGGENYGWRCYEGNHTYNTTGCGNISNYKFPVLEISQAATSACSVIGGYVYRGAEYSDMFGKYYFTDECNPNIKTLTPNGSGGYALTNLGTLGGNTLVSFGEDLWGELYAVAYGGTIYKIKGTTCSPVAFISGQSTIHACMNGVYILNTPAGNGFSYAWKENGVLIPGENQSTFAATQSGNYSVTVMNRSGCSATSSLVNLLFDKTGADCPAKLDLKLFLEGMYQGNNRMIAAIDPANYPSIADSVEVDYHSSIYPYEKIYGSKNIISTTGNGIFNMPEPAGKKYFLVVRHRNTLETWSKKVIVSGGEVFYDFTRK